jgi:phosphate starvation-inducible protein PhoH and related proteins
MSEDIFKEKRKPKNPITFKLQLNEEQKEAKAIMLGSTITVVTGQAGSGKTLLCTLTGLDMLFRREVEKLIITRPAVHAEEDLGYLPGGIGEKMDPWLQPIYQNFYAAYGKEKIDKEIAEGNIQLLPMGYIRGLTFTNAFIIADEVQNLTHSQTEALLGRLGKGSKMVLCGDLVQVDLPRGKESGLKFLTEINVSGLSHVILKKNHRNEIIMPILEKYNERRNK